MARPTLSSHPKFAKLAYLLGSRAMARGCLELIWESCYASGDPRLGDSLSVEAIADWKGERGALATALVSCGYPHGFLDLKNGVYIVHDLEDHAPDYVLRRWEREARRQEDGQTLREIRKAAVGARWGTVTANEQTRAERLRDARKIGTHTDEEWQEMISFFITCVRCGSPGKMTKDHIVPLYQGGSDAISNLQPLCKRCNSAKTREVIDHRPSRANGRQMPTNWRLTPTNVLQTPSSVPPPAPAPAPAPAPNTDPDPERKMGGEGAARMGPELPPPRSPYRPAVVAAVTPQFLRVYDVYPRKIAKQNAAQVFQELAATHPRGEAGLADEICSAFARGLLRHPPYNNADEGKITSLERFLAERRWEEKLGVSSAARAAAAPDERCALHRTQGTARRKPPAGWVISCPICKGLQAEEIRDRPLSPEQQAELAAHRARIRRPTPVPEGPLTAGQIIEQMAPPPPKGIPS